MSARIDIYDTTLRDGTQREGISLSLDDKLRIAQLLDRFGVGYLEAGWPGSNPKDAELFACLREQPLAQATLVAFGATRRPNTRCEDDASVGALLASGAPVCTLFGKSWLLHVSEVLRTSAAENLKMISETVSYVKNQGRRVIYDAEHFFDGWASDGDYALETLRAAAEAGAEALVLCDTNGGSLPWQIDAGVQAAIANTPGVVIGIHAHDDGGCAVANSLSAVRAGARHVQGTINGYGERCGNANRCAILPDLELKLDQRCVPDLTRLAELSRAVAEIANLAHDDHAAYVGRSAFAHKGGVHVAAMRRDSTSYQHIDPARVGNSSRAVLSELSGRGNVLSKAEELGVAVGEPAAILREIKEGEARGLHFEAAEASAALLLQRRAPDYRPPFKLVDYKVIVGQREGQATFAEATVQIAVGDELMHTAAVGNGPVSALDAALRKALRPHHPQVDRIHLVDYKVRILDGRSGTQSTTRVLVDSTDGERRWSTMGASPNILEASWHALADSIEYGLNQSRA